MFLQTLDVELENDIDEVAQKEPYILITGKAGDKGAQYFICAEKKLTVESRSLRDAFLDLICTYYVFNISYPKSIAGNTFMLHPHL